MPESETVARRDPEATQSKEPEIDPAQFGFRWYPILESDPEWKDKERTIGFSLKKAPRSRGTPTGFEERREHQRFVAIVSERYKVLPNEVVARMAASVARRFKARLSSDSSPPNFESEWYLHREYVTDKEVTDLGVEARIGFFVENAVNRSHALVISPTVVIEGVPLVAGRQTLRNLKNTQGRRLDYRRHTKNMVEEGLATMIEAALAAADTFAKHCRLLASTTVAQWPQVVPELLALKGSDPLPNKIYPDVLMNKKGEVVIDTGNPDMWPASLRETTLLSLYTTMAANIRALESNDERKTTLLEALGVVFAAREMVVWMTQGAKT